MQQQQQQQQGPQRLCVVACTHAGAGLGLKLFLGRLSPLSQTRREGWRRSWYSGGACRLSVPVPAFVSVPAL